MLGSIMHIVANCIFIHLYLMVTKVTPDYLELCVVDLGGYVLWKIMQICVIWSLALLIVTKKATRTI